MGAEGGSTVDSARVAAIYGLVGHRAERALEALRAWRLRGAVRRVHPRRGIGLVERVELRPPGEPHDVILDVGAASLAERLPAPWQRATADDEAFTTRFLCVFEHLLAGVEARAADRGRAVDAAAARAALDARRGTAQGLVDAIRRAGAIHVAVASGGAGSSPPAMRAGLGRVGLAALWGGKRLPACWVRLDVEAPPQRRGAIVRAVRAALPAHACAWLRWRDRAATSPTDNPEVDSDART